MTLAGNIALVTGGGRGIGRSVALALARAGADVAVVARSRSQIEAVAGEIQANGRRSVAIPCDVGERSDVERMVKTVETELGPPAILVNSAGVAASAKFVETDDDLWERHLRVNLTGTFYVCRAVVPGMIRRRAGRIINIASTSGKVPYMSALPRGRPPDARGPSWLRGQGPHSKRGADQETWHRWRFSASC